MLKANERRQKILEILCVRRQETMENLAQCREVWVFGEVMSEGMCMEIAEADHAGIPIRYFTKQNGEFVERSSL